MAPCGCFFDPRIYRIEWATTDFGQSSLYKLAAAGGGVPAGGPHSPSTYLLEPQHYLKAPVPPPQYPHFQPVPGGPQYLLPYFPPEGPGPEALGFMGDGGAPAFVELPPPLLKEGLVPLPPPLPSKENKLPPVVIALPAEAALPPEGYGHLKGRLSQFHMPGESPACPAKELQGSGTGPALLYPPGPVGPKADPAEAAPLEAGGTRSPEAARALVLPEKVLLEDAMKLFDCLPGGAEPEGSLRKDAGVAGMTPPATSALYTCRMSCCPSTTTCPRSWTPCPTWTISSTSRRLMRSHHPAQGPPPSPLRPLHFGPSPPARESPVPQPPKRGDKEARVSRPWAWPAPHPPGPRQDLGATPH